ncbi:MAG: DNA-3-methyladenine glycosylase [Elusimicrobia bacterium]|nr:DNA-3-methyladenine glycosylase [Elusimicrobiota bacterium]
MNLKPLPRSFYNRPADVVARALLGAQLVHLKDGLPRIGRIVETEAYMGPHDLASHSSRGRTARTEVMFGPPGHSYVYLIYGMYWCMNAVVQPEGKAAAVLIRALEPVRNLTLSTRGPGLLCRAMGIDKSLHGHDLLSDDFFIAPPVAVSRLKIVRTARIGVDYAGEWADRPLRFFIRDNPYVSRPARAPRPPSTARRRTV